MAKYDELSVKGLYDNFLIMEGMNQYFPSKYSKGRCCERDYMWNIANTLHGITVKGLVEHALK